MSFIPYMTTCATQPHTLYISRKTQKPAACVLLMHALVLSVFLMGLLLKGLAASAAKHAAQTASHSVCLSFFSVSQTHSHSSLLTYFICVHTHLAHMPTILGKSVTCETLSSNVITIKLATDKQMSRCLY